MPSNKTVNKSGKKVPRKEKNTSLNGLFDKLIQSKYTGIIIALVYFIVLLILSLLYHKVGDYGIETDFFWGYVPHAKKFLEGQIPIDAFRGPLYPIVLGIFGFLMGNFFNAGIVIGVLSASVVIYVTYELIKKIFSPLVSFFVVLFLSFNPVFIQYSYSAGTDMFFNALVAVTIYFFFQSKEFNYKNIILAAVFGGLSYLTRYNGVFLVSFVFVILFVNYWKISWLKRFQASVIFIVIFLVTFSPWGFYCLSQKGSFFYNENYKNIAYEFYGKGKISWDEFWFKESNKINSLTEVVFRDFGSFFSKTITNVGDHFVSDMEKLLGWQLGIFVILGLILLIAANPFKYWRERETGYYVVNLSFFALLLLVFYSERFSLFLIPFYAVIAIQPFFIEKFRLKKVIPLKLSYLLMIGLLVFTFTKSYSFNSSNIDSGPKELLVLRDWYDNHIPANERGKIIAARKAHVAYYLGMDFQLMPMADSYNDFIAKLKEEKVDYLYFSPIEAAMRRKFQFLLNPKSNHPGLKVVVYFNNPPAVLYKVIK